MGVRSQRIGVLPATWHGGFLVYESIIGSRLFETAHTIRLPDLVVV
jgi:hypothetical protein